MNTQWEMVDVPAPHLEGYAWGGLVVVYAYDFECGLVGDQFEIRHRTYGEAMLDVFGTLERAQGIATDLASLADWTALTTTDELMLQAKLMAFAIGYPGEVFAIADWARSGDLDRMVPYGEPDAIW